MGLEHPHRALGLAGAGAEVEMVLVGQGDQDLRNHIAMGAQGDLLVRHPSHQVEGCQLHPLRQGLLFLDLDPEGVGERHHRLDAAGEGARQDALRGVWLQGLDQLPGLLLAPGGQPSGLVGPLGIAARPGMGVSDEEDGHFDSLPGGYGLVTPQRITLAVMAAPTEKAVPGVGAPIPHRRGSAPLGPLRRGVRELGLALIVAGIIVLLFVGYQLWGTGIAEAHSQANLKRDFNTKVAAAAGHGNSGDAPTVGGVAAASAPGLPASGAIDHLVIPKIHLDVFVVQGVSDDDLRLGPGHYPGTVLPGQDGNAAIAGHRTTYGAPFFSLNELGPGDDIMVTDTLGRTFTYRVAAPPRSVGPDDVSVLDPTRSAQLTLTTCNPRYSDTSRLIVVAHLAGRPPVPAPAALAAPASVVVAENLGSGDRAAWGPTLLFGAAVVVLWIATRLLVNWTRRWRRAGLLVVGIAVCLVPLWFVFENVVRLLPPNI